jgi:large subunit ribosomal protein L16
MLAPKKRKYRKDFRGKMRGKAQRGSHLAYGEYGIKALDRAWVSSNQIEAARRAITHSLKRGGKVWIRVFPDKPVSGRAAGQRMGGGKGDIDRYVAVVKPGKVLFEVAGASEELIMRAFKMASAKLPFATKVISRSES